MEAIGTGANVLAFVLLALKSAKTAYETLSAIKDGPQIIRQAANTINQLHWILENLKHSHAAAEDVGLLGHLRICCDELELAASHVGKLQISPTERQSGRLWRRLKSFLSEKDLERLNTRLMGHVTTLNLRLQGISSNIVHELKHDQVQFERTIGMLRESVQTQALAQETNFSSLRHSISNTINTQSDSIRTSLDTLHGSITALASVPQPQGQSMLDLLQEIKGLLISSTQPNPVHVTNSSYDVSMLSPASASESSSQETAGDDTELINSIDRLCDLIHDKGRTIDTYSDDNEESQGIIQNLQTILQSASERGQVIAWNATHSRPGETSKQEFERISRRFERAFDRYGIAINQGVTIRKCKSGRVMDRTRGYQKLRLKVGTLALMFDHRKRSSKADNSDHDLPEETYSDYTITSTFFPDDPRRFHMLVASTFQHEIGAGAISSISRLAVNRVLPRGSRVFRVVERGDLHELQRMLRDGEASFRDHDEDGASLLFYSTCQPKVCRYLIENGLDVDHVGGYAPYGPNTVQTLCALQVYNSIPSSCWDILYLPEILSCCRVLLEAGADPTLTVSSRHLSFMGAATQRPSSKVIALAWNPELTGYIASIKTFTENGLSPLLLLCQSPSSLYTPKFYEELLDSGADIHARDLEGRTCLHIFIRTLRWYAGLRYYQEDRSLLNFEVLRLLIERGANPRASTPDGLSVSDYAYRLAGLPRYLRGYTGDLWDSVLHSCGYDIAEFRTKDHRRKARYNFLYSRVVFEKLWRGREHLCPYWDDSPWPPYGEDSTDSGESEDWDSDSEGGGVPIEDST
ncbi:ankyrin [Hypoxylon sp. FL0890]|nr:ankyrin [Hypoxylon sp. FL0890]